MRGRKKWLSAYLYYSEPREHFFVSCLKPFIDDVIKKKIADTYFFIRYWEKGYHIRLRFKGNETALQNELKPLLVNYFSVYFIEHPSQRKESSLELLANNSIHFTEYEPEVERYGGKKAILLAEKQFECSSKAVLNILNQTSEWTY
jgi:thiopeptide-type bacteriocin biosynthesis protein